MKLRPITCCGECPFLTRWEFERKQLPVCWLSGNTAYLNDYCVYGASDRDRIRRAVIRHQEGAES